MKVKGGGGNAPHQPAKGLAFSGGIGWDGNAEEVVIHTTRLTLQKLQTMEQLKDVAEWMQEHQKHDVAVKVRALAEYLCTNRDNCHSWPQSLFGEAVMAFVKEAELYDTAVAACSARN